MVHLLAMIAGGACVDGARSTLQPPRSQAGTHPEDVTQRQRVKVHNTQTNGMQHSVFHQVHDTVNHAIQPQGVQQDNMIVLTPQQLEDRWRYAIDLMEVYDLWKLRSMVEDPIAGTLIVNMIVQAEDGSPQTLLTWGCANYHKEDDFDVVVKLLATADNVHHNNDEALKRTARRGNKAATEALLELGASVNQIARFTGTNDHILGDALCNAVVGRSLEVVQLLIQNRVDINTQSCLAVDEDEIVPPLHRVVQAVSTSQNQADKTKYLAILGALLDARANVNLESKGEYSEGKKALDVALSHSCRCSPDVIERLIAVGADDESKHAASNLVCERVKKGQEEEETHEQEEAEEEEEDGTATCSPAERHDQIHVFLSFMHNRLVDDTCMSQEDRTAFWERPDNPFTKDKAMMAKLMLELKSLGTQSLHNLPTQKVVWDKNLVRSMIRFL